MAETFAPYAAACSRLLTGCQRCEDDGITCKYSRSGIIRRNRKRKREAPDVYQSLAEPSIVDHDSSRPNKNAVQSHLATDIEVTLERLRGLDSSQHNSLGALSSLSEACAAIWHDDAEFDKTSKKYFLFEDQAAIWLDVFTRALERGRPLLCSAPLEVLDALGASRPHLVHERAWLIMYYSVILSMVSSTCPNDTTTKARLRCNLWLALNDVRLLLEPSELNIQALTLLATHVEEFTMPSLCWMLVTNACRMLQALGTRRRRIMMFWYLNLLDKGLALTFGRPPTFHRAMLREIDLPALDQLLPFQPHLPKASTHALFGAHYIYQMMLKSRVTADIWYCLYEEPEPNEHSIEAILEATAIAEKPFLDVAGAASIDLGLHMNSFIYHYLKILLTRSVPHMKTQCIDSSKQMLHLLQYMVSDSEEPYNGIVWQLVCSPFTPFLALFGEILSSEKRESVENEEVLAAMGHFPIFLGKMSLRNSLALKLESVAVTFMQHAKSMLASAATNVLLESHTDQAAFDMTQWDSFLNHAFMSHTQGQQDALQYNLQLDDFLKNPVVDWIAWDSHGL
ncbi:hypothetical protein K431DRAFT_327429 [Polychaeton citri CBS 116435]|uniref:Xylanolytic transcriptional activator regulatory domain-containing protein n=1 Tax=Polychaeton citri CBS 116435 TaxID=1314669 RepID=A0A9P4UV54_9PEZI|nr:hypothetical protein K431DRAFT_327429 [Polychaeton citri CBS 116435]